MDSVLCDIGGSGCITDPASGDLQLLYDPLLTQQPSLMHEVHEACETTIRQVRNCSVDVRSLYDRVFLGDSLADVRANLIRARDEIRDEPAVQTLKVAVIGSSGLGKSSSASKLLLSVEQPLHQDNFCFSSATGAADVTTIPQTAKHGPALKITALLKSNEMRSLVPESTSEGSLAEHCRLMRETARRAPQDTVRLDFESPFFTGTFHVMDTPGQSSYADSVPLASSFTVQPSPVAEFAGQADLHPDEQAREFIKTCDYVIVMLGAQRYPSRPEFLRLADLGVLTDPAAAQRVIFMCTSGSLACDLYRCSVRALGASILSGSIPQLASATASHKEGLVAAFGRRCLVADRGARAAPLGIALPHVVRCLRHMVMLTRQQRALDALRAILHRLRRCTHALLDCTMPTATVTSVRLALQQALEPFLMIHRRQLLRNLRDTLQDVFGGLPIEFRADTEVRMQDAGRGT